MTQVDLASVAALLRRIEELPEGASGVLLYGQPPHGMIMIEGARVCWASAPSVKARLTDRLRRSVAMPADEWGRVIRDSIAQRKPLGQALVAHGAIASEDLRTALLQHTSDALAHLAEETTEPRWLPATERRHDEAFTFTPVELLARTSDSEWGPVADVARMELRSSLQSGGSGCALVPSAEGFSLVGVHNVQALGVSGIVDLTRWATLMWRAIEAATAGPRLVATLREDGASGIVWNVQGICYVALCDRSELGCILSRVRSGTETD